MNNPSLLQKAREEIDKVVGKNRLVDESDGPNLPYLQAIMKETFRLHPPIPIVFRRCIKDCKIENYMIPKK
jgi:cytochrome P450